MSSRLAAPRGARASAPETTAGFGFPRRARLTRGVEFARVFKQGQRVNAHYFIVVAAPGKERPRLGLAVGRKASSRAVVRNRIKRIAREVFRHAELATFDIVVVARRGLNAVPAARLHSDLEAAFRRLGS